MSHLPYIKGFAGMYAWLPIEHAGPILLRTGFFAIFIKTDRCDENVKAD
jgi:hypothetical protein